MHVNIVQKTKHQLENLISPSLGVVMKKTYHVDSKQMYPIINIWKHFVQKFICLLVLYKGFH